MDRAEVVSELVAELTKNTPRPVRDISNTDGDPREGAAAAHEARKLCDGRAVVATL
jgi:hypothetical protein